MTFVLHITMKLDGFIPKKLPCDLLIIHNEAHVTLGTRPFTNAQNHTFWVDRNYCILYNNNNNLCSAKC